MATQPGFIFVNLHRSKNGSHAINYVQWTSASFPEIPQKWPRFGEWVRDIEPRLYDVVHVEAA